MLGHSNRNGSTAKPALVTQTADSGALIAPGTPLTRLSYFDGKLLRASDLTLEQSYLRALVHLSNQAGGAGVVHGYEVALATGDSLRVDAGLAIDPLGRLLLLNEGTSLSINKLIAEGERIRAAALGTRAAPPSSGTVNGVPGTFQTCAPADRASPNEPLTPVALYLVSIAHAEDFCGQENVYGAICEPACATTSQRPYVVEGIVVQVAPLELPLLSLPPTGLIIDRRHLRSRVASAYFAAESQLVSSLISAAGLRGGLFCLGAELPGGSAVPVGILARSGSSTTFLDSWTVRRERIEAPPRRYWASRLAQRPWDAFLAQVLQFQCQLPSALRVQLEPDAPTPSPQALGGAASAMNQAYVHLERIARTLRESALPASVSTSLGLEGVDAWMASYPSVAEGLAGAQAAPARPQQVLIQGGIVELPSAGYLPVLPLEELSVNEQIASLLGDGVDLRFCVVRPDFVHHALEEAQHMQRISLLDGLADPRKKPKVDVLVPDGMFVTSAPAPSGGFDATYGPSDVFVEGAEGKVAVQGLARAALQPTGACVIYFAGSARRGQADQASSFGLQINQDPFGLQLGIETRCALRIVTAVSGSDDPPTDLLLGGKVLVTKHAPNGDELTGMVAVAGLLSTRSGVRAVVFPAQEFRLRRSGDAQQGSVHFDGGKLGSAEVTWQGSPTSVRADAQLTLLGGDGEPELRLTDTLHLVANPQALVPGSEQRERASKAIGVLAKSVFFPADFQETTELALFGPPPPPSELITTVRAQQDWVLFHRRRDQDFGPSEAPPPPTPTPGPAPAVPRRYNLYVLSNESYQELEQVRNALLANDQKALEKWTFTNLGSVGFAAGSAIITSVSIAPGADTETTAEIIYTAVGSNPATEAEGEPLARLRLAAAEDPIQLPVGTERIPSEVLRDIPSPALSAAGADGVMVMLLQQKTPPVALTHLRITIYDERPDSASVLTHYPNTSQPLPDMLLDVDEAGAVTVPKQTAASLSSVFEALGRPSHAVELPLSDVADQTGAGRLEQVMKVLRQVMFKLGQAETAVVEAEALGSVRALREDEVLTMKMPPPVEGIVVMVV